MRILSIDIGKTLGIAAYDTETKNYCTEEYTHNGYLDFFAKIVNTMSELDYPELILIPYPTRFYKVIMSHAKLMGIIELIGDTRDVTVIEVQDKTCKKVVLGKGNAKKGDVMKHYNEESEHIADARLFIDWYLMSCEK